MSIEVEDIGVKTLKELFSKLDGEVIKLSVSKTEDID